MSSIAWSLKCRGRWCRWSWPKAKDFGRRHGSETLRLRYRRPLVAPVAPASLWELLKVAAVALGIVTFRLTLALVLADSPTAEDSAADEARGSIMASWVGAQSVTGKMRRVMVVA